ncbi:hypothetical protein SPAN111604_10575 [Sphingomonas antarctica]|uniref:CAP domain-containing protein n=1 Tax=Sphingomonas antarctica TaxID=2040274 RepID=UPI0039EA9BDA
MRKQAYVVGFSLVAAMTTPTHAGTSGAFQTVAYMDHTAIQATSEWKGAKPADRGGRQFVDAMLAAHNGLRNSLSLADLTWDPALAADASVYAAQIAQSRRFEHSADLRTTSEGENLWMGTRTAYSYVEMIGSWSDEGADFVRGSFPKVSKTGSWHDVGHYTQMIWGGTRQVGCAVASNADDDFLVCRYFPAGNVYGGDPFAQNSRPTNLANASAR